MCSMIERCLLSMAFFVLMGVGAALMSFTPFEPASSFAQSTSEKWNKAEVYLTAKGTNDRIAKKETLAFQTIEQPDEHTPTIILDKDKKFQTIAGIGGALTDASAETFYKLPASKQQEILTALFDKEKGADYRQHEDRRADIHKFVLLSCALFEIHQAGGETNRLLFECR